SDWVASGRRLGAWLGGLAFVLLGVVLVQELLLYNPAPDVRRTPMDPAAAVVVAGALVGPPTAGIRFAVLPGLDPFRRSERGRMLYVYGAEILLGLCLIHLRLNVPELFSRRFAQHWPLVVLTVAFLAIGLSELFTRLRLRVLAEPLQWTGVVLPLVPLLAFWAKPPAGLRAALEESVKGLQPLLAYLDRMPSDYGIHALLWTLLGVLYGWVALRRRSPRFALLAALAFNFGLWVLFANHELLAFRRHPQLWLIPLALIVLVAEQLNAHRLSPYQSTTLRYVALSMLYVSSAADMFLAGLGNSVLMPLVLAVLSILGVLAGIL